jgi:alkylhydroperoxidase family enzyme
MARSINPDWKIQMSNPPRLPVLTDSELTGPAVQVVKDWNMNLHRTLAHSPDMLGRWLPWAVEVLQYNSLPERDREIVILRVAVRWNSDYEWGQHAGLAVSIGMTEADLEAVARGPGAPSWSEVDAALLTATDSILDRCPIGDKEWVVLAEHYSPKQLVDLLMTIGEFSLVAMMLTSLRIPLEDRPGLRSLAPYLTEEAGL